MVEKLILGPSTPKASTKGKTNEIFTAKTPRRQDKKGCI
jgi:hypothetical protein